MKPLALRRAIIAACLTIAIALAMALPVIVAAAPAVTVQQIAEGLTCQCGCGLTVANCNHPNCEFSVPVRGQIEQMIDRGMSGPQVIAYFRGTYGEKILSAPTTQGFNLLAWIVPFAAIVAGGALIIIFVGHGGAAWRGSPTGTPSSGAPPASGADSANEAELRRRLERELRERI